jgi:hypothetical protein
MLVWMAGLGRMDAKISSSSRAHCGAKCRHADTGSLQTQASVAIPDNACGVSGMTISPYFSAVWSSPAMTKESDFDFFTRSKAGIQ